MYSLLFPCVRLVYGLVYRCLWDVKCDPLSPIDPVPILFGLQGSDIGVTQHLYIQLWYEAFYSARSDWKIHQLTRWKTLFELTNWPSAVYQQLIINSWLSTADGRWWIQLQGRWFTCQLTICVVNVIVLLTSIQRMTAGCWFWNILYKNEFIFFRFMAYDSSIFWSMKHNENPNVNIFGKVSLCWIQLGWIDYRVEVKLEREFERQRISIELTLEIIPKRPRNRRWLSGMGSP